MIPAERAHLYVAAISHAGIKGKNNEDRYTVAAHRLHDKDATPSLLAVVADGVGGHRAGEVAAEIAVETISQAIADSDASQPTDSLQLAIQQASQAIVEQSASDPTRQGMSTTCACAWVIGNRLYIASVGDSRIYLVRNQRIHQLTTDHTWVQEALEIGVLTLEQALNHPNAHIIRRHLGSTQPVAADLRLRLDASESEAQSISNQGLKLLPSDQILLCSDGLTDLVDQAEIMKVITTQSQNKSLETLVNLANARGGHDNITIVSFQVPLKDGRAIRVPKRSRRSKAVRLFLGTLAFLLLAAVGIGSLFLVRKLTEERAGAAGTQSESPVSPIAPGAGGGPTRKPPQSPTSSAPLATEAAPTSPDATTLPYPEAGSTLTLIPATYTPWPTNTKAPP